ncbi:hypothetical protein HT031_000780 [Scenedesmus sp. PABB004]|nr:hypothetical protein HT031_000780 [Scenedesmus sp. PABB004]
MSQPLVVVGSVNADLVLRVERLPAPGETIGAASLELFPGGKGANTAAAAAKLGRSFGTFFVGAVGSDSNAAPLRAALGGAGVRLNHLREVVAPTGTAVILLQDSGENSIIIVGGANQAPEAWQLSADALQLIAGAGALLLQREIPEAVNVAVAEAAAAAGVPVVLLDAGGVDAPLSGELLRHLTVISPNETELQRLTGLPTASEAELLAAAAALQRAAVEQRGGGGGAAPAVLLKLGAAGSMLLGPDGAVVRQPAVPAPRVVDTTGAGDCFTAAFAVALLEGRPPAAAMAFAAAAASICVSRPGAMPSLPSREELEALLARAG